MKEVWNLSKQTNEIDSCTFAKNIKLLNHRCTDILYYNIQMSYSRQGKIRTGLNVRGFNTIKVFVEIYPRFLGHKYSLLSINKERHLYSRKNFRSTPKNREKHESLAH